MNYYIKIGLLKLNLILSMNNMAKPQAKRMKLILLIHILVIGAKELLIIYFIHQNKLNLFLCLKFLIILMIWLVQTKGILQIISPFMQFFSLNNKIERENFLLNLLCLNSVF